MGSARSVGPPFPRAAGDVHPPVGQSPCEGPRPVGAESCEEPAQPGLWRQAGESLPVDYRTLSEERWGEGGTQITLDPSVREGDREEIKAVDCAEEENRK